MRVLLEIWLCLLHSLVIRLLRHLLQLIHVLLDNLLHLRERVRRKSLCANRRNNFADLLRRLVVNLLSLRS